MRRKMSNAGQTLRTILVLSEAMKWHVQNMPQNSPWGALTCWQYISMHSRETMQEGFIGKYEIASTSISPWTSFVKPLETFLWRSMTNHKAQSDFYNVKTSLQWRWDKAAVAVLLQAAYLRDKDTFTPKVVAVRLQLKEVCGRNYIIWFVFCNFFNNVHVTLFPSIKWCGQLS